MLRVCEKHAVRALPLSGLAVILGSSLTIIIVSFIALKIKYKRYALYINDLPKNLVK